MRWSKKERKKSWWCINIRSWRRYCTFSLSFILKFQVPYTRHTLHLPHVTPFPLSVPRAPRLSRWLTASRQAAQVKTSLLDQSQDDVSPPGTEIMFHISCATLRKVAKTKKKSHAVRRAATTVTFHLSSEGGWKCWAAREGVSSASSWLQ